eukprot:3597949-Amphidinium_carterae.1
MCVRLLLVEGQLSTAVSGIERQHATREVVADCVVRCVAPFKLQTGRRSSGKDKCHCKMVLAFGAAASALIASTFSTTLVGFQGQCSAAKACVVYTLYCGHEASERDLYEEVSAKPVGSKDTREWL